MKRNYGFLTVLATAGFMLMAGCAEAPTSGMTAADQDADELFAGKKPTGGGGSNGGKTSNYLSVTLGEGAVTAGAFTAKVSSDNDSKLQFNNDDANQIDVTIQLLSSWEDGVASSCSVVGDEAFRSVLVGQLNTVAANARVGIQVDQLSLGSPSDINTLTIAYHDPDHPELGTIRLGIPAHGNPPPTVDEVLNDGTNRDYRFRDGVVRVWATRGGGPKDDVKLFCNNPGDTILVSTTKI